LEPSVMHDHRRIAAALADELGRLAQWLGLGDIWVSGRGDLADDLSTALALI